jgi:hypothetical protein
VKNLKGEQKSETTQEMKRERWIRNREKWIQKRKKHILKNSLQERC